MTTSSPQLSADAVEVPSLWSGLIDDVGDHAGATQSRPKEAGNGHSLKANSEIYFPLPANREQRRIVEAIDQQRGVLVQGPPGTGKSHTIANLMCHLLATGKRVLITAETGRALQVLKNKLPKEIQPLCVTLGEHLKSGHRSTLQNRPPHMWRARRIEIYRRVSRCVFRSR